MNLLEKFSWPKYFGEKDGKELTELLQGRVAMVPGYRFTVDQLQSLARQHKNGVSPNDVEVTFWPQMEAGTGKKRFALADYFLFAVPKQSDAPDFAWQFIVELTTRPQFAQSYAENARRVPALSSLISWAQGEEDLNIFATQAVYARRPSGVSVEVEQKIIAALHTAVLEGEKAAAAVGRVEQWLRCTLDDNKECEL